MEKARELLESGKFSVTMVAEMVGMRNLKNFRGRYKEYLEKHRRSLLEKSMIIYLKKTFIEGCHILDNGQAFVLKWEIGELNILSYL